TATLDDWAVIAIRMTRIPAALEGYIASLRLAAGRGDVRAQRQVQAGIDQAGGNVGAGGFFATFAASARVNGQQLPTALRNDLQRGVALASDAYGSLATMLRDELMPQASAVDAVGPDKYALFS